MANRTPLTTEQIDAALTELNAGASNPWELKDNKLLRRYVFRSFGQAFARLSRSPASIQGAVVDTTPSCSCAMIDLPRSTAAHQ